MTTRQRIRVPAGAAERIDRLLARALSGFSRRRLQQFLDEGLVRVDGRRMRKGEVVSGGREIEVEVLAGTVPELPLEPEPALPLLFEDASCVAIDKPAGRPGHALRSGERGTVANFLAARFPECVAAGGRPLEAGLVHRLDTWTSGVLLAARSREAWRALCRQFAAQTVEKRYLALVHGVVVRDGQSTRALGSDPRNRRRVRVLEEASSEGRPAVTRFHPIVRGVDTTLLEVEIPTGSRHQIRAHLAAIGHPVVGDVLYGGGPIAGERHLLHAARLVFDHPASGERITIESPLPPDFEAAMRRRGL